MTAIVDELSEPIKYQSAADKRAAQMVVFGIDEMVSKHHEHILKMFLTQQNIINGNLGRIGEANI